MPAPVYTRAELSGPSCNQTWQQVKASWRPQHCQAATWDLLPYAAGQSFRDPVPNMQPHASTTWLWCRLACVEHCVTLLQVGLVRQMERSQKEFQDWRREREREVMQLRRQVSTCQLWLQQRSQQHISNCSCRRSSCAEEQTGAVLAAACALYVSAPLLCVKRCLHQVHQGGTWPAGSKSMTLGFLVQGRKTAAQVQRLEALHAKQQAVLRRKTEEAEAARKRLHVRASC